MRTAFGLLALLACSGSEPSAPPKPAPPLPAAQTPTPQPSDAEPWYRTLADDHATPDAWLDAVANIMVQPDLDHPEVFRGGSLRSHAAPSVSELLERRISSPGVTIDAVCTFADALLRWDPAVGKPIAAREMARAIKLSVGADNQAHGAGIATLALHRADAGDATALDEYAAWLVTLTPTESGWGDRDSFVPMALFADRPAIAKASDKLFAPGSPWLPIVSPKARTPHHEDPEFLLDPATLGSPGGFIAASGLNRHVVAALGDNRPVGTLTVQPGELAIEYRSGNSSSITRADTADAPTGTTRTVRVCDYYAAHLASHDGAPVFDLAWPDARRDKALGEFAIWVKAQAGKPANRPLD